MTIHYNHPMEPQELQLLKILQQRMPRTLPPDKRKIYHNLQRGYEGEVRFHELLKEHLHSESIVLYDRLLDGNGSLFQLDCIILQQRDIWHLEIKNMEGDFILKDNAFHSLGNEKELNNPLNQLDLSNILFKQLLDGLGYTFPFNHMLYSSIRNSPFIRRSPTFPSSIRHRSNV